MEHTPEHSIAKAVGALKQAREYQSRLEDRLKAELDANPQIKELREKIRIAKADAERCTEAVHAIALDIFTETKNKRPHGAVQIKESNTLVYDPGVALLWCTKNGVDFLSFNRKAFDKAMLGSTLRPDFIEVTTKPKVFIAQEIE